jgi:hypothetical protein
MLRKRRLRTARSSHTIAELDLSNRKSVGDVPEQGIDHVPGLNNKSGHDGSSDEKRL